MTRSLQSGKSANLSPSRKLEIDFFYLDLETCSRCTGTNKNLDLALGEVSGILESTGVNVVVRKALIESEEQARELGFFSSPTIRVNGQDITLEFRESRCEDCEECACYGEVHCRVWVFQGREYTEAPKAMIVDAILRVVYGKSQETKQEPNWLKVVPDDLKRFFSGKDRKSESKANICCPPGDYESCCGPLEKAVCCDTTDSGRCGC